MANRVWTAKVFVNSDVGEINPTVEANDAYGAKKQIERIYGPVQDIVNIREITPRSRYGGGGSAGGFFEMLGGCAFWLIAAVVLVSWLGGGNDDKGAPEPSRVSSERVQKQPNPRFTQPAPQSFETVQKRFDPADFEPVQFSSQPPVQPPVAPTPARSQCIKLC
jgi:hypothetical protein